MGHIFVFRAVSPLGKGGEKKKKEAAGVVSLGPDTPCGMLAC